MSEANDSTAPQPSHIGRFRVLGQVGRGGMGVVYRAVDDATGQEVAVKSIEVPKGSFVDGIRREIAALRGLDHPGVVSVVDVGVEDGLPWYAMELIEGESLANWMASPQTTVSRSMSALQAETDLGVARPKVRVGGALPDLEVSDQDATEGFTPLMAEVPTIRDVRSYLLAATDLPDRWADIVPLLNLAALLCDTLAYLHGEGVVHCDLKPENVLVRRDGTPALVDFGLTGRVSRSREVLELSEFMAGSALYMSPEQIRAELVDPRSDIYALGCILYEMIAGEPPFTGRSSQQVLMAHLTSEPAPLSEAADVPEALNALVMGMLARDPIDRIGHAGLVAATLREVGAEAPRWPGAPTPRAYLYRPRTAGREEQLSEFQRWMAEVRGQTSLVALVDGEIGAGKTRLMTEMASLGRSRSFRVMVCRAGGGAARRDRVPFATLSPLFSALAGYCNEIGEAGTERILGANGRWLSAYEPSLTALPGQDAYPPPEPLAPEVAASRVFGALKETLASLSQDAPILLLLDDLQWADELTLAFLAHLVADPIEAPVLVVAAVRSEDVDEVAVLTAQPGLRRQSLEPLTRLDIDEVIGDMLAVEGAPRDFLDVMAERSGGNPHLLSEYLHDAVERGVLRRDAMGRWQVRLRTQTGTRHDFSQLPLPSSVGDLMAERLARLSPDAQRVVAAACVLGRDVYLPFVAEMTDMDPRRLDQALWDLIKANVFEHGETYPRFVQEPTRHAAYQRLGGDERRRLHGLAGEVLERASRLHAIDAATVAEHYARSDRPERAGPHLLQAARKARDGFALGEAERLYLHYIEATPELTPERYQARQELARDVLFQRRDNRKALAQMEKFAQEATALDDEPGQATALRLSAVLHRYLGEPDAALARLERSIAMMRRLDDVDGVARALNSLGNLHRSLGDAAAARRAFDQALEMARQHDLPRVEAVVLGNIGLVETRMGRYDEGERFLKQALERHKAQGDREGQSLTLTNLATLHGRRGRLESAARAFRGVLRLNEEVANDHHRANSYEGLGTVLAALGRPDEAEVLLRQGLALHQALGHLNGEATNALHLAEVLRDQGRHAEALDQLDHADALAHRAGSRPRLADVATLRAELALDVGDPDAALDHATDAAQATEALGLTVNQAAARLTRARALAALGRRDDAEREARRACPLILDEDASYDRTRALVRAARLIRRLGPDPGDAERLIAHAAVVDPDEDPVGAALVQAERTHQALARGEDPGGAMGLISASLPDLTRAPRHAGRLARERLGRAVAAFAQGRALEDGEAGGEGW